MFAHTNKLETITEKRIILYEVTVVAVKSYLRDSNKLLCRTRNVGGNIFTTRRYDIVTKHCGTTGLIKMDIG